MARTASGHRQGQRKGQGQASKDVVKGKDLVKGSTQNGGVLAAVPQGLGSTAKGSAESWPGAIKDKLAKSRLQIEALKQLAGHEPGKGSKTDKDKGKDKSKGWTKSTDVGKDGDKGNGKGLVKGKFSKDKDKDKGKAGKDFDDNDGPYKETDPAAVPPVS